MLEKKSSQKWGGLVWKILVDLGRVFCTYLEPPSSHIMQNQKNDRKIPEFINLLISPYLPFKGDPLLSLVL